MARPLRAAVHDRTAVSRCARPCDGRTHFARRTRSPLRQAWLRPDIVIIGADRDRQNVRRAWRSRRRLGGEIVSMDSRQVYRDMDIGTAKASPEERAEVPHHGLDIVDPDERYSAGRFARDARELVADDPRARTRTDSRRRDRFLSEGADRTDVFRSRRCPTGRGGAEAVPERTLDSDGSCGGWTALDPGTARKTGRRRRTSASIPRDRECAVLTGKPLSWWQPAFSTGRAAARTSWCSCSSCRANGCMTRINRRVLEMIEAGLVEEVRALVQAGYDQR